MTCVDSYDDTGDLGSSSPSSRGQAYRNDVGLVRRGFEHKKETRGLDSGLRRNDIGYNTDTARAGKLPLFRWAAFVSLDSRPFPGPVEVARHVLPVRTPTVIHMKGSFDKLVLAVGSGPILRSRGYSRTTDLSQPK